MKMFTKCVLIFYSSHRDACPKPKQRFHCTPGPEHDVVCGPIVQCASVVLVLFLLLDTWVQPVQNRLR